MIDNEIARDLAKDNSQAANKTPEYGEGVRWRWRNRSWRRWNAVADVSSLPLMVGDWRGA